MGRRITILACLLPVLLLAWPAGAADSAAGEKGAPVAAAAETAGPSGAAVDLTGTWHVLVHYKDAHSPRPDVKRWNDRLWVFKRKGDDLVWTDYPIVVFKDHSGRFEQLGTNRQSRVLGYWEPNADQLAQIRSGLEINPRGAVTKTLHASKDGGWTSSSGGDDAFASARYITYESTWTIQDPSRPRFLLRDVLGSATTDSLEGRTLYQTTAVEQDGNLLRGSFDRDGVRKGTFEMRRSGKSRHVQAMAGTRAERAYKALFGEAGRQLYAGTLPGGGSEKALRKAIASGDFGPADRAQLRKQIETWLRQQFKVQGNDPRAFEPQIQSLARKMVHLMVDEGKSVDQIGGMLEDGRLRP